MRNRPAVLVTRPSGQATALCEALCALGYQAFSQPLLELVAFRELPAQGRDSISRLDTYKHLIFISGNAVRFGMESILAQGQGIPDGIQVYAIGESTAEMLRRYGVEAICAGSPMTSESLLALSQLQLIEGQKLLIVKGQGGRTRLRDGLSARGALVDDLACYQRQCPKLAPGELAKKLSNWHIGLLLISSGEGLCNLLTLLSPPETINLSTVPVIVPSRRVARMAEEAGFTTVFTAENASNAAMLKMVEHSSSRSESV